MGEKKKKHAMSDLGGHTAGKASDCPACLGRSFVANNLAEKKPEAITSFDCRQSTLPPTSSTSTVLYLTPIWMQRTLGWR